MDLSLQSIEKASKTLTHLSKNLLRAHLFYFRQEVANPYILYLCLPSEVRAEVMLYTTFHWQKSSQGKDGQSYHLFLGASLAGFELTRSRKSKQNTNSLIFKNYKEHTY